MDDPGTYIYVAFLVISLIAGWLKNRKKKAEPIRNEKTEPKVSTTVSPAETFRSDDRWFDDVLGESEPKFQFEQVKQSTYQEPLKRVSKEDPKPIMVEGSDDESTKNDLLEDFDLKKAIIYSEILNRPEL